jgi:murein DD-endopeptidase MepM/ murein hydrolase activator NlpD
LRLLGLILAVFLCCSLIACGKTPAPEVPETTPEPEIAVETPEPTPEAPKSFIKEDDFRSLAFEIGGGLIESIRKTLPESESYAENIGAQIIKALFWDLDHRRDLRKGDRCRILYKTTRDRFKIRLYGVRYKSTRFDKTYQYFFFWESDKKSPEFFDSAGQAVAKRMKNCPLIKFDEVISLYRPGVKDRRGVKFRVKTSTEARMPFPAVVERLNWDLETTGLSVEVRYPGTGLTAQFLHLSAISEKVEPGSTVTVGDIFARTGITGKTQVPQLDYRLFKSEEGSDSGVDPFEFHGFEPYTLPPSEYSKFVSVKHQVLSRMEKVGFDEPAQE